MVQPNWPSEDEPDYSPDFTDGEEVLRGAGDDAESIREDLEEILVDE